MLEVHRILDKSTQIAQQLLTEIESIDDPKWKEDSYMEHVFLHINLTVNFAEIKPIVTKSVEEKTESVPLVIPMDDDLALPQNSKITIFEKLFWCYLSRSNHMRNNDKIPCNLSYEEVLQRSPIDSNASRKIKDRLYVLTF